MAIWPVDLVNGRNVNYSATISSTAKTITAITKAANAQITATAHGFEVGQFVLVASVAGMTQMNNIYHTVASVVDANNFTVSTNSTGYSTYTSGGTATSVGLSKTNPLQVNATAHGYITNQIVYISGHTGMTDLAAGYYTITGAGTNHFFIGAVNSTSYATYTGSGTAATTKKVVTGATQANPCVVTIPGHSFLTTDNVFFENIGGMTQLNGKGFGISAVTSTTITLKDISSGAAIDSTGYGAYTSGGDAVHVFKNMPSAAAYYRQSGDEVRVKQTWKASNIAVGSGNIVFTKGQINVSTSVSLVGTISVNDYIAVPTAANSNGSHGWGWDGNASWNRPETFYRVTAVSASTITLASKYNGAGGATVTTSTVLRVRLGTECVTTGSAGGHAVTLSGYTAPTTYSGGWSADFTTQDGETWLTPVTTAQDYYCIYVTSSNQTIEKFGLINGGVYGGYRGYYDAGTNNKGQYLFTSTSVYVGLQALGTNSLIQYSVAQGWGTNGPSVPAAYCGSSNSETGYSLYKCYVEGTNASSNYAITGTSVSYPVGYCLVDYSYAAFVAYSGYAYSARFDNCKSYGCSYGLYAQWNNRVINCIFESNTYGVGAVTQTGGTFVKGCTFLSNSYGIYLIQHFSARFEDNAYISNGRDFYADPLCGPMTHINHNSTTPTTYAFDLTAIRDVQINGFTIDAPSLAKAFSSTYHQAGYLVPSYTLTSCTQFSNGSYYPVGQHTVDTSVERTTGRGSTKATISSLYGNDFKVRSYWVKASSGKTLSIWIKQTSGSWSGTLIPVVKLNGSVIYTGTTISSLTTSWVQYTYTISGGLITADGELSLEFIPSTNGQPYYFADFEVS